MMVHIFEGKEPAVGYTTVATGENLPKEHGPWTQVRVTEIKSGDDLKGDDPDKIIADIKAQGYHLSDAKVRVR